MKYSTRLSDAMHILVMIDLYGDDRLSSEKIAKSVVMNPSSVRQFMCALRKAGIVESVKGHPMASLARPASEITMLDVYRAVEGDKPLLHLDTNTNQACGVGVNIPLVLQDYYRKVQDAAEEAMSGITLQDVVDSFIARTGGRIPELGKDVLPGIDGTADERARARPACSRSPPAPSSAWRTGPRRDSPPQGSSDGPLCTARTAPTGSRSIPS